MNPTRLVLIAVLACVIAWMTWLGPPTVHSWPHLPFAVWFWPRTGGMLSLQYYRGGPFAVLWWEQPGDRIPSGLIFDPTPRYQKGS